MKDTPILYQGEMARAILGDYKTKTRRTNGLEEVNINPDAWKLDRIGILDYMTKPKYKGRFGAYFVQVIPQTLFICPIVCPYGQPGDRLWVRETFQLATLVGDDADEWWRIVEGRLPEEKPNPDFWKIHYKSTEVRQIETWRPSIFMPRWASRITLEIVDIRVERVQKITLEDVLLEGVPKRNGFENNPAWTLYALADFQHLWNSINAKRGLGWDVNPWVWVIEFKRITQ